MTNRMHVTERQGTESRFGQTNASAMDMFLTDRVIIRIKLIEILVGRKSQSTTVRTDSQLQDFH